MKKHFFISHYDGDVEIAKLISETIQRISLTQIYPWYSADLSPLGGLKPGDKWFQEIVSRIKESKAVIAILTPNSIKRPWIYFECGIAESLATCEVIPVCIGISRDKVLTPLSLYQVFQLSDITSLNNFFGKLFSMFDVKFDKELTRPFIEKTMAAIGQIGFQEIEEMPGLREVLQDLKSFMDKRFLDILQQPSIKITNSSFYEDLHILQQKNLRTGNDYFYSVSFEINMDGLKIHHFLEIRYDTTFENITNELYFLIRPEIRPFTYLEEWVIRNKETKSNLIIREIQSLIPAHVVLKSNEEYEVIRLDSPYNATDSHTHP